MNKFFSYTLAVAIATVSLAGCEKVKDATSKDIKANDVKFDFTADVVEAAEAQMSVAAVMKQTAAATNTFSKTRMVDISELSSEEIMDYASKISKVTANSSVIEVTVSPAGTYTIENLTFEAVGVSGSLVVPSYTTGDELTPPAGMDAYLASFVMKLLSAKKVEVTVFGKTDAPADATVNISYGGDLVLKASLL